MATLMDTLKSRLNEGQPQAELGQTARVEKLSQAKTGKEAGPSEGPRRSTIQEKSAAQTTNLGMEQQSLANRLQTQQLTQEEAGQDTQAEEARLNLGDRLESYKAAFETQSEGMLREFERDTRSLEDSRDAAKVEQLGFLLRLQDQSYINNLKQEGELGRFDSAMSFKESATRAALQDQRELLDNDIAFKTFMGATDREFKEQLAQMDMSFADKLASDALEGQRQSQIFTGIGNIAAAGAQYAASSPSRGGE